jgi:hypothetical protein
MTVRVDREMDALEAAAEAQDGGRFDRVIKGIDWESRNEEDILRAIPLALAAGALVTARELSTLGARLFPANGQLGKFADILAPPRVVGTRPARESGIRENRDWLKAHSDEYRGKWVALRSGVLVGVADSPDELRKLGLIVEDTLVTRVY